MNPALRVLTVPGMALMGFVTGGILASKPGDYDVLVATDDYQDVARDFPLPHQVPQYAGGHSFRCTTIHDVLHELLKKHGAAWYKHRNRWPIIDDLAAGMDRMGQPGEALKLMRAKLPHQQQVGLTDELPEYARPNYIRYHASSRPALPCVVSLRAC